MPRVTITFSNSISVTLAVTTAVHVLRHRGRTQQSHVLRLPLIIL